MELHDDTRPFKTNSCICPVKLQLVWRHDTAHVDSGLPTGA